MVQEKDIPVIVERALKEGNPLYPVPKIMDKADCEAVIRRMITKDGSTTASVASTLPSTPACVLPT